ncbi:hypothetical protein [Flavobacterium chungbukense]|uniref:Molybdenum ABC transporter permease n=1 Tax=Flavobacterium chungbukense TaxID=877464 RepID=A0ABP7XNJ7_9FLAO|nr:hypothetical protein [Flavobacterium chungbukense]
MAQIIILLLLMIAIGVFIYITKYKDGKPKVGIKRNNYSDYFKDYSSLKLYWTSICFIFFGIAMLIAILILEIVFI